MGLLNIILISAIELTGVVLRYVPFHRFVSGRQKRRLLFSYCAFFLLQLALLLFVFSDLPLSPRSYKVINLCGGGCFFLINCILIPRQFFKHVFILSIQATYYLFLHSFIALASGRLFPEIPVSQQFQFQSLGFLLLFALTFYPLWRFLKNSFIPRIAEEKNYYWKWIWLVPCFTLLGNMVLTMNDAWISTLGQFFARLFMAAAVFASWKCISLDFEELDEKIRIKNENELMSLQMKSIADNAELLEKKDERIRILRHDMRHQMQMLLSLISENENEKALAVIKKLDSELSPVRIAKFCQNQILNAAISIYADKAISSRIALEYEISMPKELPFDENDLAVLFANALENAVNASLAQPEENRRIKIQAKYENCQLVLRIENTFAGTVIFDKNEIPVSKKEGHGFGMKSILSVVNKYNGTAVFTHENNIFSAGFIFFQSQSSR